jgi:hypothetical protein
MWKIQVDSKLKIFVWRLAKQSLPDLLHHLNKSSTLRCTLCGAADSWRHCLLESAMVRNIWSLGDEEVVEHLFATTRPSAKHWIFSLVDLFSYEMFIKVLISLGDLDSASEGYTRTDFSECLVQKSLYSKLLVGPKMTAATVSPKRSSGSSVHGCPLHSATIS